jgi:hypothetical protein
MSLQIELYRGSEYDFFGKVLLMPIVQQSLEQFLGRNLTLASIQIILLNVPEGLQSTESPIVENLTPEFGYVYVKVFQSVFLVYQHPHPLHDVITNTLREKLMNEYPDEKIWGFRIDAPGIPYISTIHLQPDRRSRVLMAPDVQESVEVHSGHVETKPNFTIRRLEEEAPPIKTLHDFGVASSTEPEVEDSIVQVLISQLLYDDLCQQRHFSTSYEQGGFLVGRVYQNGDNSSSYLLELKNALAAKFTGASFLHLTFTGDSFVEVKHSLRQDHPGDRLLGWYHTHLFPATSEFGLSSIDVELHFGTFTFPWQVAGLVNLDPSKNERILRFYARKGKTMVLCPHRVIHECN